ncbi:MAG: toll/interleukin-1 receptor domain-containing protein [bacterium]|nr:toll/interleukin-1 receptor domain-containing protein [bacterium]
MSHIFISYSRKDSEFAHNLADQLETAGFKVWIDVNDIVPNDEWVRRIEKAVEDCDALVVVLSRSARDSEWVERETLLAMDRRKPVYPALIEEMPLPLHLINRQFVDFRADPDDAFRRLVVALHRQPDGSVPKALSPEPTEENFFPYLEQITDREDESLVARALYLWAKQHVDEVQFGGRTTPGFHARVRVNGHLVNLFSVWAYNRQPAVQLYFQFLMDYPPYDQARLRLSTLHSLNRLLDEDSRILDDKADRRPTLPLTAFNRAEKLEAFQEILAEIIDNLRSN